MARVRGRGGTWGRSGAASRPVVRAALERLRDADRPDPNVSSAERHIVLAWLHTHADDPDAIEWDPELPRAFVDLVRRRVRQAASTG